MEFNTTISGKEVDIYDLKGIELDVINSSTGKPQKYISTIDDDINSSGFIVKWTCEIEAREWGIKGILYYPTEIKGSIFIHEVNNEGDEINEYEYYINIGLLSQSFKVEAKRISIGDTICPQSIEINVKEKSITIQF